MPRNDDDAVGPFPPDDDLIYGQWRDVGVGYGPLIGGDPDDVSADELRAQRRALQRAALRLSDAERMDLEAAPGEVQFEAIWRNSRPDGLDGELIAANVSPRTWRLSGKPVITPLDLAGSPLPTRHVVSADGQIPDYVEVLPGHRARALINWGWWDGTQTSATVRVTWDRGASEAPVAGPTHPERRAGGDRMTTSSDWWRLSD